ncbi:MAG TPA: hypothetical protein DCL43_16220 [Chitinophagaceae bacterium]|nr:hypothetical protein [Chitinophagaceae bacterium]HAN37768.1 hypothetical protein [Chitinophagaceae bacterium]
MDSNLSPVDALQNIRQMMDKSSRFISLSGLSGISAGICALIGAWQAYQVIHSASPNKVAAQLRHAYEEAPSSFTQVNLTDFMGNKLFIIATATFIGAFVTAFFFTWLRSQKTNVPLWGTQARRLLINTSVPMLAGGIYLLALIQNKAYGLIAPGCLIFYGLALVNASKYTLHEVRWLGYGQLILGCINLLYIGQGLYFWAAGFGILHIVYGAIMWLKYERNHSYSPNAGQIL